VANTLLKNLHEWTAQQTGTPQPVPVGKIGISHAVIIEDSTTQVPDPRNFTELKIDEGNPFGGRGPVGSTGAYAGGEEGYAPEMSFGPAAGHGGGEISSGFGAANAANAANRANIGAILSQPNQPTSEEMKYPPIEKTNFTVQFVWRPIAHEERKETRPAPTEEEKTAAKAAVEAIKTAATAGMSGEGMSGAH
jgi:hypothetical protein